MYVLIYECVNIRACVLVVSFAVLRVRECIWNVCIPVYPYMYVCWAMCGFSVCVWMCVCIFSCFSAT